MAYPNSMWTTTTIDTNDYYTTPSVSYMEMLRQHAERQQQQAQLAWPPFGSGSLGIPQPSPANPENTLMLIKKSIKEIKAEAVGEEAQNKVKAKIERLRGLGALAQATILETELQVRVKLMRAQEWDYKVLPYDSIKEFESANKNWDGKGGRYQVHVDLLEKYQGTVTETEAKDKIMPDAVLDDLEKAKDRKVFDEFSVLWVEKVKDPLLLGSIQGCKDFFLIAMWGEDVSFDQIMTAK